MKIAIIHSIYKPDYRGGAETVVANVVSGLSSRGHEIFVIAVGRENRVEVIDGIKVYRVKPFNLFNFLDLASQPYWRRLLWHIIDMVNDMQTWRIYKILKKEKPELALTHNLMGLGYEIPRLLKILRIRNIHTVHDMQLIHPSGLIRIGQQNNFDPIASISLAAKIYCFICRQLFGSPERVIFPSEYIKNIYGGFGFFKKSKVMVLGNPLPSDIKPTVIKSQLEPILTLVFVSQIEQYKGVVDLIKAVESLPGDWQLLIAGEGSALREATKWALNNKKIKFIGRLDQSQLEQKIWSVADLLINPSQVPESFGLVVVEAYARGVPVLAARIGALQELVGEGETGWLFKPGDRFDLRQRIEFIMANREKLLGLKSNCIQMAEKFTLGSYLEKLF